jgi:Zn-dependent protease
LGVSLAFYLVFSGHNFSSVDFDLLVTTLFVVGSSFVLHELLHKFTAQHFGFWSEFRVNYRTLAFSVVFALFAPIVIAAPGATMIYGPSMTKRQNGMISAAGPLLNLALGGLFLLLLVLAPLGSLMREFGYYGFVINVWLSAFNLLPIGPLDGRKVLDWGVLQYIAIAALPFLGVILLIFLFFNGF